MDWGYYNNYVVSSFMLELSVSRRAYIFELKK